ncbi:long-chain-fatty-acid--CoA ligase [Sulfuriferula multivorans]|uniref:Long-chain-fatty-acid--CoA ligase n=1 Tax=Sulfuriferula multivorans TaxID=1559896 RepID=A0A401JCJ1_9PROT|nr:AMP-binding protein [Sulfuriferula multivorans]GBL45395.1 long-chain-fatty-acid--CoA ligase [Sulfuriferula multivorans]
MEAVWLQHYPRGVPAEVDIFRFASLKDMLEQSCGRFRERPAFTNMGVTLSYGELDRLSRDFGAYLQQVAGLRKGERVAIMLPNLLQYPVVLFGALRAGMVVVNVNPLYTARELQHQLADSGAVAVVVLENFAHTLQEVVAATAVRHVITTRVGDLFPPVKACLVNFVIKRIKRMVPRWSLPGAVAFNTALKLGARHTLSDVPLTHADIAFLQYTGGTTGVAKGAMLTHGNLLANVEQTSAWIGGTLKEGEEVIITPLPLYHIFALTANLLLFVKWGANDVLITNPRDIPRFVRELRNTRFTAIVGVNTLFNMLLNAPGFDKVKQANAGALKVAVAGGMAVQRAVAERWQQTMGVALIEGYGLTEASPIVCANPLDAKAFSGKIGMPIPSTRVTMRDEAGRELPLGEEGELCVQGPQVMRGYWNMPEETARVLGTDGWLRTGDMGVMDAHGVIRFIDRCKDVIVVSGFKVYPNEVEEVVMMHPGVKEVGAVGVPDEKSGAAVKVFVVKKDAALTAAAVIAHCKANLTAYKVPKQVEFRDKLPKSAIGKILRRELKQEHAASASAAPRACDA